MLHGAAWAARRDRASALVEDPQQRHLADWREQRTRRRAELEEKTARRQAECTALLQAIAAEVAADVSAAVAAALRTTRVGHHEGLVQAPTTTSAPTTSVADDHDLNRAPATTTTVKPPVSTMLGNDPDMAASYGADLATPTPSTCSTICLASDTSADLAASAPTTYSAELPSHAASVYAAALTPSSAEPTSSTTTACVSEQCCFDPEPVVANLTPTSTPDLLEGVDDLSSTSPSVCLSLWSSGGICTVAYDACSVYPLLALRASTFSLTPPSYLGDDVSSTAALLSVRVFTVYKLIGVLLPAIEIKRPPWPPPWFVSFRVVISCKDMIQVLSTQLMLWAAKNSGPPPFPQMSTGIQNNLQLDCQGIPFMLRTTLFHLHVESVELIRSSVVIWLCCFSSQGAELLVFCVAACSISNLHCIMDIMEISGDWQFLVKVGTEWNATLTVIIFDLGVQCVQRQPIVFKILDHSCCGTHYLLASATANKMFDFLLVRRAACALWISCCLDNLHCSLGNITLAIPDWVMSNPWPPLELEFLLSIEVSQAIILTTSMVLQPTKIGEFQPWAHAFGIECEHLHWPCFPQATCHSTFSDVAVYSLVHAENEGWFQFYFAGKASLYSYGTAQFQWEIAWPPTALAYSIHYGMHLYRTLECSIVICYLEIEIICAAIHSVYVPHLHWDPGGFSRHWLGVIKTKFSTFACLLVGSYLHSSAPTVLLRRRSSSTSLPSRRDPHVALAAATERARSGTLSPADAHNLFDELLRQATPVPERALTGFLAAVARAPASAFCRDSLSLAVALFDRMPLVAPPTVYTYGILLDCCCRARHPDLALAFLGRFLRAGLKANNLIVNTLLKVLCHARRTDDAVDVLLHRMPDLGCVPDVISYTTVIKGLCADSRSQRALDLLRLMGKQEGGCSPDVVSYNTVIHGFLKEDKFSTASNLFGEMVQQGVVPDAVTYTSIIDVLCKRGRSKEARQILDRAIEKGLKPDIVAYSTMLHGYATEGCLVDMNNLYNLMVGEGVVPNQYVFNILINACAKCGSVDEAFLIFEEMQKQGVKPDLVTHSTMIDALCRKGRMNDAIDKFNLMINMGIPPDVQNYGCLIQGYCTHGDLLRAKELVYEMMEKGIRCPGVMFFNSIINKLCKEGRVTDAQDIFDLMIDIGEKPDVITFSSLIEGYCIVGKMQKACRVHDDMVSVGIQPNAVVYSTLIDGYFKAGMVDAALTLFNEMLGMAAAKPDTRTYGIVLDGLFKAGKTVAAKEMIHEMIKSGVRLSIWTYNIILDGLSKNGCADEAILLFEKLQAMNFKFNIRTLNIMIDAMFNVGRIVQAKNLFAAIQAKGLVPDVITYTTMMSNLIEKGFAEEADSIYSSMETSGCASNSRMLNIITRKLFEKGEIVRAINYMSRLDGKNMSLEASTISLLISLFSRKGIYHKHKDLLPARYQFLEGDIHS